MISCPRSLSLCTKRHSEQVYGPMSAMSLVWSERRGRTGSRRVPASASGKVRHQPGTDPTLLAVEINPKGRGDVKSGKVGPRDGCGGWRTQECLNAGERRSRNGRPNRAQPWKHEPGIQDGGRSAHQGGSNDPRSPPPARQENHQRPDGQDQQITGSEKQVHISPSRTFEAQSRASRMVALRMLRMSTWLQKSRFRISRDTARNVAHVNTRLYAADQNAPTKALPPRPSGRNPFENSNSADRRGRARGLYFEGSLPAGRRLPQRPLSALC